VRSQPNELSERRPSSGGSTLVELARQRAHRRRRRYAVGGLLAVAAGVGTLVSARDHGGPAREAGTLATRQITPSPASNVHPWTDAVAVGAFSVPKGWRLRVIEMPRGPAILQFVAVGRSRVGR
jgi:hypothetical protein